MLAVWQPAHPKHGRHGYAVGNTRNGTSQKTMKGEQGQIEIEVSHDRQGTFEPQLVKKARHGRGASMRKSWRCTRVA